MMNYVKPVHELKNDLVRLVFGLSSCYMHIKCQVFISRHQGFCEFFKFMSCPVVCVCSFRCLKEDPATMSLLQRSLDPEKTLGLVDVLYTAVFDINRWKERK